MSILPFIRPDKKEPTDVKMLIDEVIADNYERIIVLGQDAEGYWFYKCSKGIDRVLMIGMLELMKRDIFQGMSPE